MREQGELHPIWAGRAAPAIRIGLACSLNWGEGRRLIERYRRTHPTTPVWFCDTHESELAAGLESGRFDVVIAPQGAARPEWRSIPLWREPLIAIFEASRPSLGVGPLAASSVRSEPLLLAGDAHSDPALAKAVFDALGGRPSQVLYHDVQRDTLLDLVALGLGVTVTPGGVLGAYYPGVVARPVRGEAAQITYALMWRKDAGEAVVRDLLAGLTTVSDKRNGHAVF
jgi:DNA-binding transcriptional LysR family regulator